MPEPTISTFFLEITLGPPSLGLPSPSKVLPSISSDTDTLAVSPRNFTEVSPTLRPIVEPKTCTIAIPLLESSTWPLSLSPTAFVISTISPYAASLTFSTKRRGPETWDIVRYESGIKWQSRSEPVSQILPSFPFLSLLQELRSFLRVSTSSLRSCSLPPKPKPDLPERRPLWPQTPFRQIQVSS